MTQVKYKIKRGDFVEVITGKDKGKRGKVLKVFLVDAKALVEGVNQVTRNVKPSSANPDGPYTKMLPIHISNIAVVDSSTDSVGKVGYRQNGDVKERFFKKSGNPV
jgi:large subunit ribosomal protein L24